MMATVTRVDFQANFQQRNYKHIKLNVAFSGLCREAEHGVFDSSACVCACVRKRATKECHARTHARAQDANSEEWLSHKRFRCQKSSVSELQNVRGFLPLSSFSSFPGDSVWQKQPTATPAAGDPNNKPSNCYGRPCSGGNLCPPAMAIPRRHRERTISSLSLSLFSPFSLSQWSESRVTKHGADGEL